MLAIRIFVTKRLSKDAAKSEIMVRRRPSVSEKCTNCPQDRVHVLTWTSPAASSLHETLILELDLWLSSHVTGPDIYSLISRAFDRGFVLPDSLLKIRQVPPLISCFSLPLMKIGWHGFRCGLISS